MTPYQQFTTRLKLLISKSPQLITTSLSNIFTMRLIGNKTHGDLAEIAISEFINQFMYDFKSIHVGKDMFRSKGHEEDIKVVNEITKDEFAIQGHQEALQLLKKDIETQKQNSSPQT